MAIGCGSVISKVLDWVQRPKFSPISTRYLPARIPVSYSAFSIPKGISPPSEADQE